MVREVRFSREDADGAELPDRRDRFDELDDFVDDLVPAAASRKPAARGHRRRHAAERTSPPIRHLAGADWLCAPSFPASAADAASGDRVA